jgi:hypothetical protein
MDRSTIADIRKMIPKYIMMSSDGQDRVSGKKISYDENVNPAGVLRVKTKKGGFAFRVFERAGGVKRVPNRHLTLLWRVIPPPHIPC